MEDKNPVEYFNMDGTNFVADQYLQRLLKDCSLKQIMDVESVIVKDTQTLHSDMQTLVYENYNKFISATDTIRKMKTDFNKMETEMKLLATNMSTITSFSEQISNTLQGTRQQLIKLSGKHSLLQRLQFLSILPAKLKQLIEEENYEQAVQDYNHAQKVLMQYGDQPSFQGIQDDCSKAIENLKIKLKSGFHITGKSAQSLTQTGELLLQLNEKPSELAKEMLHCATQRMYEQIVNLQDQADRDMIEFIDLGIEGFLNDLTLVVSSYYDMFLSKHLDAESADFEETARAQLNAFVTQNMDKYLSLVQDRVEVETAGHGDSQIMLRALDRLHRRLLAIKNICRGVDMSKTGIEIIINSAHQLCRSHLKNLKAHFNDSLSAVRLSIVSVKSDNSPSGSGDAVNLNDLINDLYVSTMEKVKGVLHNLMVFLQPGWSFNLKHEYKGSLCIEEIRENLLVGFLKYISYTMVSFSDTNSSSSPNLLLVLSKTCLEMDKTGVHFLIALADDLYEIDSESSAVLTHETELSSDMRDASQSLLDAYVRLQGLNISLMLRKSVETREWLNCLEPRTVRAVMKRCVEELSTIDGVLNGLYETGMKTTASSDSSRKTHFSLVAASRQQFRSNWSNYTPVSQTSFVSNVQRLFSEKVEIFAQVEFSKISILTGIIKISLKTLLECIRLKTFSKFGLQQIQVDAHFLQMNLWRFVSDEK